MCSSWVLIGAFWFLILRVLRRVSQGPYCLLDPARLTRFLERSLSGFYRGATRLYFSSTVASDLKRLLSEDSITQFSVSADANVASNVVPSWGLPLWWLGGVVKIRHRTTNYKWELGCTPYRTTFDQFYSFRVGHISRGACLISKGMYITHGLYCNVAVTTVTILNPVTIKIFPGAEFPGGRGVLIA